MSRRYEGSRCGASSTARGRTRHCDRGHGAAHEGRHVPPAILLGRLVERLRKPQRQSHRSRQSGHHHPQRRHRGAAAHSRARASRRRLPDMRGRLAQEP
jgi:hypothetical protein